MTGLRTWVPLFRLLAVPVLSVYAHPCRTLRQVRELDEGMHFLLRAMVRHMEAEHPDLLPREPHLRLVRGSERV